MDVEQAMQLVDGTADVRDFALWVEAANTLAAEVRRLRVETIGDVRRTADGKPVTFGGLVYHPDCVREDWCRAVMDPDNIDVPTKIGRDNCVCESISVTVEECYSTPEAAREGRGVGHSGHDAAAELRDRWALLGEVLKAMGVWA